MNRTYIRSGLLMLLVLCIASSTSNAQEEIIDEDGGGSAPSGWTFNNNVATNDIDNTFAWLLEAGSPSDEIITSSYDISSYVRSLITIEYESFGSGSHNAIKLEISYDGGVSFTETITTDATDVGSELSEYELDSTSTQVVFKFSNSGTSGRGVDMCCIYFAGIKSEPTNHPTSFTATANGVSEINLSWTDATGAVTPDGYLILASDVSLAAISDPVDGNSPSFDSNLADGSATVRNSQGLQSRTFSNLLSNTEYFFKIYSYSNFGSNTDYKLSGTIESAQATTDSFNSQILISQYIESSNFKAIELWNTSGSTIDFSSSNLVVRRYSNGSSSSTNEITINSGTLADDALMVIGGGSTLADYLSNNLPAVTYVSHTFSFDGDDALDITLDGSLQDVFGTRGSDPGTEWSGNGVSTNDQSIELQVGITEGTEAGFSDPSIRFQSADDIVTTDSTNLRGFGIAPGDVLIFGGDGWRLLSLPKSGGTVSDISDDTAVQGITGGDNASSQANFYIYDSDGVFEEPTNVTTAWGDGLGFALYFFDNTQAGSSRLPLILDADGSEPSSDVTVSLNSGSANLFTLVGNPFNSNYNTAEITLGAGNISDNLVVWFDSVQTYLNIDRTKSFQRIAPPWQGFWVETADTAATEITIPISGKTSAAKDFAVFSKRANNRGDINFSLSSEFSNDENIRIALREYATLGFDRADGSKIMPLVPEYAVMSFKNDDLLKAVESLPWDLDQEVHLDLELTQVQVSGGFTFAWEGLDTIPEDWQLTLHDYETGAEIDMRFESEYQFDSEAPASKSFQDVNPLSVITAPTPVAMKAKSDGTRFGITIVPGQTVSNEEESETPEGFTLEQNFPNPFNPSTNIRYTIENAGEVRLAVYNMLGQKVADLVNSNQAIGTYQVNWNAAGNASGVYFYRLESAGQILTRQMTLIK